MKQIDENRLERELEYRFGYLAEFMEFRSEDIAAVHRAAEHLAPVVPALVDAVYIKLFNYDATMRHFVPPQHGYEGSAPKSLEDLSLDHEMIQFRKHHLGRYFTRLVTAPYDMKLVQYLDQVGKMHTPYAGSARLSVPLVQMNALMGYVADALLSTILGLGLPAEESTAMVRAFNKLLWLQNDLITRHYQRSAVPALSVEPV
jgi:hypothetical protein